MPVHDWSKIDRGVFHSFHTTWIGELTIRLNGGILPPQYFALGEQIAGEVGPDVLALREPIAAPASDPGGIAVDLAPPQVQTTAEVEAQFYVQRQRRLAIRHASDNEIVALIEIVSPSNKHSRRSFDAFLRKSLDSLEQGIHLLLIDLQPPSPRDPQGIHGAIWQELAGESYSLPSGKTRMLAAYSAGDMTKAYAHAVAIGEPLVPMPLFLTPSRYVNVPLEETYMAAYQGVPNIYRKVLEAAQ